LLSRPLLYLVSKVHFRRSPPMIAFWWSRRKPKSLKLLSYLGRRDLETQNCYKADGVDDTAI